MSLSALRMLPFAFALSAATPLPAAVDAVRDQIVADARTMTPASLAFDRVTRSVRSGGGSTTRLDLVERWDGKRWRLLTRNGARPTKAERLEVERTSTAAPVPGYHRMAALLAAATESSVDTQGRTVLIIPKLPPGSVRTDSGDISSHLKAEVTLASAGGFVERVKVTAREPFKMNLLIKVLKFEQVSEYRLDASGKPRLAAQTADSAGTMFGFPGGEKSEVTYSYR